MKQRQVSVPNRYAAVVATIILAGLAGCASPPSTLRPWTAQLTIDGNDIEINKAFSCTQTGWTRIIDIGDKGAGMSAVIETGATVTAKAVRIRNLDGFAGSYWDGNNGTADASRNATTWTITGTIEGFNIDTPAVRRSTRSFTLKANC